MQSRPLEGQNIDVAKYLRQIIEETKYRRTKYRKTGYGSDKIWNAKYRTRKNDEA